MSERIFLHDDSICIHKGRTYRLVDCTRETQAETGLGCTGCAFRLKHPPIVGMNLCTVKDRTQRKCLRQNGRTDERDGVWQLVVLKDDRSDEVKQLCNTLLG